jgi:hypothetical protein
VWQIFDIVRLWLDLIIKKGGQSSILGRGQVLEKLPTPNIVCYIALVFIA